MKVRYYQLLFDFRQGVRENFMKAQEVRLRTKIKNHYPRLIDLWSPLSHCYEEKMEKR